jgi:hypothetical protein
MLAKDLALLGDLPFAYLQTGVNCNIFSNKSQQKISSILDTRYWMLDAKYWILDIRFWMLAIK